MHAFERVFLALDSHIKMGRPVRKRDGHLRFIKPVNIKARCIL
jgi:hypothetical protein